MKVLSPGPSHRPRHRGFSLVELACVSALSMAVFGAAVLAFRAISIQQTRSTHYGQVTAGAETLNNFYGLQNTASFNTWFAPNYGRAIQAEEMRELFYADQESASAVFALPRIGRSNIRPTAIALPPRTPGRLVDTPNAFLSVLAATAPEAASIFTATEGLPPAQAAQASVFIIQPSLNSEPDQLTVRCLWEIDIIPVAGGPSTPSGTYASVRRYVGPTLTRYYDIFYKDDASAFGPVVVHFERAARAAGGATSPAGTANVKRAAGSPFYFMWWPDPAAPTLRPHGGTPATSLNGSPLAPGDVRLGYAAHYGQSSLFFVVPMFPSIQ